MKEKWLAVSVLESGRYATGIMDVHFTTQTHRVTSDPKEAKVFYSLEECTEWCRQNPDFTPSLYTEAAHPAGGLPTFTARLLADGSPDQNYMRLNDVPLHGVREITIHSPFGDVQEVTIKFICMKVKFEQDGIF